MVSSATRPNIILIFADDLGFSDLGCYGGEIQTPNLDSLAHNGLRLSHFYNTPMCSPSRAALLTGLHPHQVGMGILANTEEHIIENPPPGYTGTLSQNCVTLAELLKENGYGTFISGKWHLTNSVRTPDHDWPMKRGFDHHYGNMNGANSYFYPTCIFRDEVSVEDEAKSNPEFYYTDAISDQACQYIENHFNDTQSVGYKPMFLYVAYTCPHWPLHAKEIDIAKYKGKFDEGWDRLREQRLARLREMKILEEKWPLTDRDPLVENWEDLEEKDWWCRRMEVYAAQIDCMDQGIGRIMQSLKTNNQFENSLIIFISDNGATCEEIFPGTQENMVRKGVARGLTRDGRPVIHGNDEDIMPGDETTHQSYGRAWSNLSNTPFRLYKKWAHEGGVATPFIAHWPNHFSDKGQIRHQLGQLPDIMATILDITGISYPSTHHGKSIPPMEGVSLMPILESNQDNQKGPLFFEKDGNCGIRTAKWKLVREHGKPWELYDMIADRCELHNLEAEYPEIVAQLAKEYERWAKRTNVLPFEDFLAMVNQYKNRKPK